MGQRVTFLPFMLPRTESGRAKSNLSKSFISQFEWASVCATRVNIYLTDPTFIWIPVYAKHAVPVYADPRMQLCAAGLNCLHMCKLCFKMWLCACIKLFKVLSVMCGMGGKETFHFFGSDSHLFWATILWEISSNMSAQNWFSLCSNSMTNGQRTYLWWTILELSYYETLWNTLVWCTWYFTKHYGQLYRQLHVVKLYVAVGFVVCYWSYKAILYPIMQQ